LKIDFIPKEEKKGGATSSVIKSLLIALLVVFVLMGVLGIRYFKNNLKMNELSTKESALQVKEESLKDFKDSFEKLKDSPVINTLSNHVYFSELFAKLENSAPSTVRILSLSTDESSIVKIDAQTVGGYAKVSLFLKTLKKNGFLEPVVKSISTSEDKLQFSVESKLSKEMVLK